MFDIHATAWMSTRSCENALRGMGGAKAVPAASVVEWMARGSAWRLDATQCIEATGYDKSSSVVVLDLAQVTLSAVGSSSIERNVKDVR